MAGGVVLVALGLWVVLQSTKGPLVTKLGLIKSSSSSSSSSTKTTTSATSTTETGGGEGSGLSYDLPGFDSGVASRYVG